jgi:hypothetical protein
MSTDTKQQELVMQPAPAAAPIVAAAHQESAGMQLLQKAIERGAGVDELDKLITLADRLRAIAAQQAFTAAMVEFKKNPPTIEKTRGASVSSKREGAKDANYSYKYANLADVCNAIVRQLAALGITHKHTFNQDGSGVTIKCTLTHLMGHSESAQLTAHGDTSGGKNGLQGIGSTITFLERYTLLGVCGLALDDEYDDDGASGITEAERGELQKEAAAMRQRGQRQSPAQTAGRDRKAPPPEDLLEQARKAADHGHTHFGKYWRELTEAQRGQLMPEMNNLTERASAASAQLAAESGSK